MFHHPDQIRLSDLCRDQHLAAIFRDAEDDGLTAAEVDRPVPPRLDGAQAVSRILELA